MKAPTPLALFLAFSALACNSSSDGSGPDGGAGSGGGPRVVLDGGGPLPKPPDGAAACPKGACNYQTNEGCAAGESCFTNFSGQTVTPTCVPAGSKTSGASCADQTECAAGYLCVAGSCQKLCCGGDWTGCPSPNEHCFFEVKYDDGKGGAIDTGAMVCYPVNTCDALTPSSCPTPGQTCQIVDQTGATACRPEGTQDVGDTCSDKSPCKGGLICREGAKGYACRQLCRAVEGDGAPCTASEICDHYVDDPEGVGECVSAS